MCALFSEIKYSLNKKRLVKQGQWKSEHMPIEKMDQPIDFVVTWVDGADPEWLMEKAKFEKEAGVFSDPQDNGEERFRDWDIFRYWFRGVEKYAPWVRNVYLVTCGHVPEWLNTRAPKLKVVKHTDFIPEKYLPVFSIIPIELNLHRIKGISEYFVYFNDDVFLNKPVTPEDFFRGGKPNYTAIAEPLKNYSNCAFDHMRFTAMGVINREFKGRISRAIREHPERWFAKQYGVFSMYNLRAFDDDSLPGMCFPHLAVSVRKSTMQKVWEVIPKELDESCSHRFRTPKDLLHQLFLMWEMLDGDFNPVGLLHHGRNFNAPAKQGDEIVDAICNERYRMICINDCESVSHDTYLCLKKEISAAFCQVFPKESLYEK